MTAVNEVSCRRCGHDGAALGRVPYPGPLGERIRAEACAACWTEWLGVQLMVINEFRLSPLDPRSREIVEHEMRRFFALEGPPPERTA